MALILAIGFRVEWALSVTSVAPVDFGGFMILRGQFLPSLSFLTYTQVHTSISTEISLSFIDTVRSLPLCVSLLFVGFEKCAISK